MNTYGNGLAETRSYDQDYRLTGITDPNILSWTLGYNADDDITGITDNLTSANSQGLNYDALNRLTTAAGNYGNLGYSFDADGNRTQLNVNGVLTNYTYGAANNRLTKVNAIARSYDADGSTTHDGTYVYAYDDSERLTGITKTGLTVSYLYNALGQRSEKTVNGASTVFLYDESGHLLGEYTPSGTLIAEHIWLNNQPIGVITSTGLYYVQTDQLDTPRAITNSSKAIVWQWSTDPFGNGTLTGSFTYNLRFPGQYYDAETGHDYNYFRDYDPSIGRYIESDPIGLFGGINTYAYTNGDPIIYMDRYGLCWFYSQSTGQLIHLDDTTGEITKVGIGYAGYGAGLDNPFMQNVSGQQPYPSGPLPQGTYTIGPEQTNVTQTGEKLLNSMRLAPWSDNEMFNRAGFLIHGPHANDQHNSSEGCPVFNKKIRNEIGKSKDKCFVVIQ